MTVAEELLQQGRQEGRQQAMTAAEELLQQGQQQAIKAAEELIRQQRVKFINAMLKLNIDAPTIALAAELPLAEVNAIIDEITNTGAV